MSKIKAIVMDVDGTLFNSDKQIGPKTKELLIKAQEMGIKVVLASGRPTTGLLDIGEELSMKKHHGLFVSFNGSKVIDCETMEELFDEPMSIEESKAVLNHMKKFDRVRPMFDKGEYMMVNNVYDCYIQFKGEPMNIIEYESRGGKFKLCEADDLASCVDKPLNKILTTADPEYLQEHHQAMMEPFKDSLCCVFTAPFFFEYTAKGIDKAKALDTVFSKIGITKDEVISFGDGHNDMSIIQYAGIGVAMENAVDDLKAAADEITLSNDEEGIAVSLLKHIPELNG